jgi:hypothetical protein
MESGMKNGIDFESVALDEAQFVDVMDTYIIWRLRDMLLMNMDVDEEKELVDAIQVVLAYMGEGNDRVVVVD